MRHLCMDSDNPGALLTGEEEAERTLNAQDHSVLWTAPEWLTLTASGRLTFFFPEDDLGSLVSIAVANPPPISFWVVTFGYYTVITTKNTLLVKISLDQAQAHRLRFSSSTQ